MCVCFSTKQGFEILEFGSICLDRGKVSLSDKEDCQKAAVFQGYPFKRTKNVRDYPKGCYLDIWNDGVYWNPNKDGRSHMAAAEICYRSGNYCRKLMIEFSWTSLVCYMLLSQEISKNYFVGQRLSEQGGSKSTEKYYIEKERIKTNSGFYVRCCTSDGNICKSPLDCSNPGNKRSYAQAKTICVDLGLRLCSTLEHEKCNIYLDSCNTAFVWTQN